MKKIIILVIMAIVASSVVNAQTNAELVKAQQEQNALNAKLLNAKPNKEAKKRARKLEKVGWQVVGSGKDIARQITSDQLLAEELMADESGNPIKRYIQQSSKAVSGALDVAIASARAACQQAVGELIEHRLASAMELKRDNEQTSAITAITVSKFHQRAKAIMEMTLNNQIPGLCIYRVLPNNNYEADVTISFDKKQLSIKLKQTLQRELEIEGDNDLNEIVDQVLVNLNL